MQKLIEKFNPQEQKAEDFIFAIHDLLKQEKETINPELAMYIHRIAKDKLAVGDLYEEEKEKANQMLLSDYAYWRDFIDNSENAFATAAKLAVVGNIIDYGAHSLHGDMLTQINMLLQNELAVNKTKELQHALDKADSVLYLGDNAGEIFFDKLFVETINHPNLTFAVRGCPVINDVTKADANKVGLTKICNVIDNGNDAPSTLLKSCSDVFMDVYRHADLIISKGQGNFEGLMNEGHPNTFFMLIAKCQPMAELLGGNKGDMVITKMESGIRS